MSEFVIITGLSGAGRSQAADDLEDLGWFVIDNLPTELIPKVVELVRAPGSETPRVALVVGAGARHAELIPHLAALHRVGRSRPPAVPGGQHGSARPALRGHPPPSSLPRSGRGTVRGDRARARAARTGASRGRRRRRHLQPERPRAPRPHRGPLRGGRPRCRDAEQRVVSFGYKHGLPVDVDVVLDCRFLPNPHWVEELRPLTGLDAPGARATCCGQPAAGEFLEHLEGLLDLLLPGLRGRGEGRT